MANTTFKWTARWIQFYFSFGKIITKVFTRSVRVKYVVCSPTKGSFEFDWITIVDSLKVILFSGGEKIIRKTSPRWILKLDLISESFRYIFRSAKSQRRYKCIYKSKVWYVQCWAKRLTLNFIEFIHSQVWRRYGRSILLQWKVLWTELDNNNMGCLFAKSNGSRRFKTDKR